MKVPSTEVQNNFGKYLKIAEELEDVIITKKGREIAKLVSCKERFTIAEEAVNYIVNNNRKMSYEEFIEFTEKTNARYELIDGDVFFLESPNYAHQSIIAEIILFLLRFFKGKKCKALTSPFDITLEKSEKNICVVQPDIVVICDLDKVNEKDRYMGVPTLAVEVLSKSTRSRDMIKKLDLYMQTGIKEYWIVDTDKKEIYVYSFAKTDGENDIGDYTVYTRNMILTSKAFPGLDVPLEEIFAG